MKIFYHNDADGKAAAYLVRRHEERICGSFEEKAQFIEMDYDKAFPLLDIEPDEKVWIVDFSIEPETMRSLLEVTENAVWIDHHVTSLAKYDNFEHEIEGLRSTDLSGCELTWLYIFECIEGHSVSINSEAVGNVIDSIPRYIRLIGDRDTWKFEFGDETRYMHEAFKAAGEPGPEHSWWWDVVDSAELTGELNKGKLLLESTRNFYKSIVNRSAYEAVFEGHKILVCNCPIFTSEIFGDRLNDYPFVAVYCHNGNTWKVSLYSVNMDVVEYAQKRGGGGHPRACGFISEEVPFRSE